MANFISAFATPRRFAKRMQRSHQTDALSGKHSLTELHLVHSVVNHHLQIVIYLNNLVPQMRQHGRVR